MRPRLSRTRKHGCRTRGLLRRPAGCQRARTATIATLHIRALVCTAVMGVLHTAMGSALFHTRLTEATIRSADPGGYGAHAGICAVSLRAGTHRRYCT